MIESRTLAEQVAGHLEEAILSDDLSPGTELSEVELAEHFGVSRGPVREALRELSAAGLVSLTPRRSAMVRVLSKKEILDAYEVRGALEQLAIRLCMPKLTGEHIAKLDELMATMESIVDAAEADSIDSDAESIDAFFEANAQFHHIFIEVADNATLRESHNQVSRPMARYRRRSLELRGDLRSSLVEHATILEAVHDRNVEKAVQLVQDHIRVPLDRIEEVSDAVWERMSWLGEGRGVGSATSMLNRVGQT